MYLSITLKLLVGSAVVFVILRLVGKKTEAKLTPFDLIYFLVLGGIFEGPIYDPSISIWNVLYGLLLWGGWVFLINYTIKKTFYTSKVLQGEPSVLINEGKINQKVLEENLIDLEQLRAMLRQNNCYTLRDVKYAILEIDGKLSVIRHDQEDIPSILLIDEGRVDEETLKSLEFDEEWLFQSLEEQGFSRIEDVFNCELIPGEGLYVASSGESNSPDMKLDG